MKPAEADGSGIFQLQKPFVADQVLIKGISGNIDNFVFDFVGKPYTPHLNGADDEILNSLELKGK